MSAYIKVFASLFSVLVFQIFSGCTTMPEKTRTLVGDYQPPEWVNKGFNGNNSFYKAAANAAIRAVKDAEPMPLPISKFSQWKTLTLRFDPKKMFGGF